MALRNAFGELALEATLQSVKAIQETIRDTVYRRTDPLPTGGNIIGAVSPSTSVKAGQGKFFLASTGRMTLSVAGNLRAVIQNPALSGKNVFIVRIASFATGTGYANIYINPTTGVPITAARPTMNAIVGGGNAPVATMRVDTDTTIALNGGTNTGLTIGIPANARTQLDLPPLILAPGVTLGLNIPFAGAADSTMSIYWYEE